MAVEHGSKKKPASKKRLSRLLILLGAFVALPLGIIYQFTDHLEVSRYDISNQKIPASFDGYVIVQVSDLHNNSFGKDQVDLISEIAGLNPDIILLTGDLINRNYFDYEVLGALLDGIVPLAPTYAITGNHELDNLSELENLIEFYGEKGVIYLEGETVNIPSPDDSCDEVIALTGQTMILKENDPDYWTDYNEVPDDTSLYNIYVNHYSNYFDKISKMGFDLVISGHTHGGIIRLPYIGGLISNGPSMFPKYDGGVFVENGTVMVSSRGLGDSFPVPRINNPHDLVAITLKSLA